MKTPLSQQILVVEDNDTMREAICQALARKGLTPHAAISGEAALEHLQQHAVNLIITDLKMGAMDGITLLRTAKSLHPELPVIVITAYGTVDNAVEAMKLGAADYITKPFSHAELLMRVERSLALVELQEQNRVLSTEKNLLLEEIQGGYRFDRIIGKSESMKGLFKMLPKVAAAKAAALILGESGTGKELIARAIHYNSPRRDKAFVRVDCGSLPEGVLESELFGHERGAFTSAVKRRLGRFELADRGTIFLDEIGNLTPTMQMKLLRVLQEGEFLRVGGEKTITVDVRVLAATNADLDVKVRDGSFREDLFYRLAVIVIKAPPLRERQDDIPLLAAYFLQQFNRELNRTITGYSPEAMAYLQRYSWPGNIRQLRNWIERAMALAEGDVIGLDDLPGEVNEAAAKSWLEPPAGAPPPLVETLEHLEKTLLERALEQADGVKSAAARLLNITVSSLYYKLEKYGLIVSENAEEASEDHDH